MSRSDAQDGMELSGGYLECWCYGSCSQILSLLEEISNWPQIWDLFEGKHMFYGNDPDGSGYKTRAHLAEEGRVPGIYEGHVTVET